MPDVDTVAFDTSIVPGSFPAPTITEVTPPPAQPVATPAPAPQPAVPPSGEPADDGPGITTTSIDDTSVTVNDFALYKGRKGVVDRIAILNPRAMASGRAHYQEGKGYFLCHSKFEIVGGQEVCLKPAICCKKLDESTKRFAALIIQYAVLPDGKLMNPLQYSLKLWRISDNRFVELRDIHTEFPLDSHDLTIRCTEESFQKLTIQASAQSIMGQPGFPPALKAQIQAWVTSMSGKAAKSLGRKLSDQELRERLGVAVTPAAIVNETPIIDASMLFAE